MPARSLLERAADPREVPGVFRRAEAVGQVLRTQHPGVVGEPARRVGPLVTVDEFAGGRHADRVGVERERRRIANEVKQVDVRPAEFLLAVDAERVIPDDPTAAGEPEFPRGDHLQFRGVFVADRQPKRAVGPQHADDFPHPLLRPVEVGVGRKTVVIGIVVVADVERRVGERQMHAARGHPRHQIKAVAPVHCIDRKRLAFHDHDGELHFGRPRHDFKVMPR